MIIGLSSKYKTILKKFLLKPDQIENTDEIKNMTPDDIILILKVYLSSQVDAFTAEREDVFKAINDLLKSIGDENDPLSGLKKEVLEEILKFRREPLQYEQNTQNEIKIISTEEKYIPIWIYLLLRLTNYVKDGKLVRTRFSSVIKCSIIRFFKRFYSGSTPNEHNEIMYIFDSIVEAYLDEDKNPLPYTNEETHEYDFHEFIKDFHKEDSYKDIKDLRFMFRRHTPLKDSPHVVLCISGFTSEGTDMQHQWQDIIDHPSQPEVYSLNWSAIKPPEEDSYFYYFRYGWTLATKIFESRDNAVITGRILARILLDDDFVFKNKNVSLLGFSMGTEVIANCLDELRRRENLGIIQNVYFFGGAAKNVADDEWNRRLQCVSGRIVNSHSSWDGAILA